MSSDFEFNTSSNKKSGYTPIYDRPSYIPLENKLGTTTLELTGKVNPVTADYSGEGTSLLKVVTVEEDTAATYVDDYTVLYGDELQFQDIKNIRNDILLYFIIFSNLDKEEAKKAVDNMSDEECLDFYNKIFKEIAIVDYFNSEENLSRAEAFNELEVYIQEFKGIDGAYDYILSKQKRPAILKMLVELGVCEDVANEYVKDIPEDELDDEYTRIVSIVEDKNNYYEKNGFLSESFAGTDLEGSFAIIKVSPALATKNISYKDNYSRMIDYIMVTKNISEEEATVIANDYSYGNIMNYGNKYNVLLDYYVKKGMPLEEAKKHVYYLDYNTLFDEYDYVETANKLIDYYIGLGCDRSIAENYVYNLSIEVIEDTLLWDTDEKSLKDANYKLYLLSDEEAYNKIYDAVKSVFETKVGFSGGDMSTFESMTKEEIIDYYIEVKQKSLKGSSNKESVGDQVLGFIEDKIEVVGSSITKWGTEVKDVGYALIFGDEETRKATGADLLHRLKFAIFDGAEGILDTVMDIPNMFTKMINSGMYGMQMTTIDPIIDYDVSGHFETNALNKTIVVDGETKTLKEYFESYSVVDPEGYLAMSIDSFGRQVPSLILTICTGGQSKSLSVAMTFFSTYATTNGCTYEDLLSEKQVAIEAWENFINEFEKLSPEEKLELLQDEESRKLIFTMYEKAMQAYATDNNDLKIKSGTTAFKEGLIECAFGGVMGSEAETFVSAVLGEMLEETISFGADPTVNYWSDVVINLSNYDLNSMEGWIGLLQGWGLTYTDFFTDEETFQEFLDTMIVTATTVGISRTTTNISASIINELSNKLNITDQTKLNKILELTGYLSKDMYNNINNDESVKIDPLMQAPIIYDFEVTPSEISSLVDDVNSNGSLDNNSKNKLVECLTTKSSPGDQFNAFVCLEKYDVNLANEIFAGFDSHQKLYFIKGFSTYDNNIFEKYCNEATFNSLDTIDQSELIKFLSDINPKVASKFYSLANSEIQKNLDDSLSLEITSGIFDDDYVETIDIDENTLVRTNNGVVKYADYIKTTGVEVNDNSLEISEEYFTSRKYSDYTLENIIEKNPDYPILCNMYFELASDLKTQEKLKSILYLGGYGDFSVSTEITTNNNPVVESKKRVAMAELLLKNPETFDYLVENNINLFHGTTSDALPGILNYGVHSLQSAMDNDIEITTGEVWSRYGRVRDFVSFTDDLSQADQYASILEDEAFPVIVCTTEEDVNNIGTVKVGTDKTEVGVENNLPVENISAILVPSDKVEYVKSLTNSSNIEILSIDTVNSNDKLYSLDDMYGHIIISETSFNNRKNDIEIEKFKNSNDIDFIINNINNLSEDAYKDLINGYSNDIVEQIYNILDENGKIRLIDSLTPAQIIDLANVIDLSKINLGKLSISDRVKIYDCINNDNSLNQLMNNKNAYLILFSLELSNIYLKNYDDLFSRMNNENLKDYLMVTSIRDSIIENTNTQISRVFDCVNNQYKIKIIESGKMTSKEISEKLKKLNWNDRYYINDFLERGTKNDLMSSFFPLFSSLFFDVYDVKYLDIKKFVNINLPNDFKWFFGNLLSDEDIKKLENSHNFWSPNRFVADYKDPYKDHFAMAFNSKKGSFYDLSYNKNIIISNIVHESLHQISQGNNGSGFRVSNIYRGINECVTEYFNELIMGMDHPYYTSYQYGVERLKIMVAYGIFDLEELKTAYLTNNVDYFKRYFSDTELNTFLDLFNKSISTDVTVRTQALKDLDIFINNYILRRNINGGAN